MKLSINPKRPDLAELDTFILSALPSARLDEGVKYWRWACFGELKEESEVRIMVKELEAEGYFIGYFGKDRPLTALFFAPAFD